MVNFIENQSRAAIYNGDCKEVISWLKPEDISAVVTDPPYGIADVWKGGGSSGWSRARAQGSKRNLWDTRPDDDTIRSILALSPTVAIWGGNYFNCLPVSRGWLVWTKPERGGFSLSEAELCWTSLSIPVRVFDCHRSDPDRQHPTQKPVALMEWTLDVLKIPARGVVFDPFMGSGTTGVAALKSGRDFIGVEADPEYFKIAAARLHKASLQPRLID